MSDRMQWEKFWYRDFMDDVRMCSPGSRGVWISILSEMWGNGRNGDLVANFSDLGRISGSQDSDEQIEDYVGELWSKGVIDLFDPSSDAEMTDEIYKDKRKYNGLITVRCRRLKKEEKDKENNRIRQDRFKDRRRDNGQITVQKKEDRRKKIEEEKKKEINPPIPPLGDFDIFWDIYPRKVGKGAALKSWNMAKKKKALPSMEKIIGAISKQIEGEQWQKDDGQFIPHPATWINQLRWEDEVKTWRDEEGPWQPPADL